MDWIKENWEKLVLFVVTLIVVLGSIGIVRKSIAYPSQFEEKIAVPKSDYTPPEVSEVIEAQGLIQERHLWRPPVIGSEVKRELPLFVSIPIVDVDGRLIDMTDPKSPLVRPPVSNNWLMENNLDFLRSAVLSHDPDGDKFSNLEEWGAKTSPIDPEAHPLYGTKLNFVKRQQQSYIINFAARPDPDTFQISRKRSGKWPERQTFLMGVGGTSDDGQFRIESLKEKKGSRNGITVDATELTVTHLPTKTTHTLVRGVDYTIPTYFAEFTFPLGDGKSFYKKVGESFALDIDLETKYKVVDIQLDRAVISPGTGQPEIVVTNNAE